MIYDVIEKLPVRFREEVQREIAARLDSETNPEVGVGGPGGRKCQEPMSGMKGRGKLDAGGGIYGGNVEIEEIRFRIGQPPELCFGDGRRQLDKLRVTGADMRELLNYLTGYSLYAYENEIRQGYFTIAGGHRVGVVGRTSTAWCGSGARRSDKGGAETFVSGTGGCQNVTGIADIGAVNIRIAHERKGCALPLMPYIRRAGEIYNTLILAQPGVGKTTYLRDCIRLLSSRADDMDKARTVCKSRAVSGIDETESVYKAGAVKVTDETWEAVKAETEVEAEIAGKPYIVESIAPMKVSVVDERSEIAACYMGVPQNDLGPRTDVLDGCPKQEGMRMLLRSMSPQVIAVDELGGEEDFRALYEVMHSGIRILGTVHAGHPGELLTKPYISQLIKDGQIQRLILLQKDAGGDRNYLVYDGNLNLLPQV
ncbi:MAG: hypothetical protein LIO37_01470 [Clostridiales bacterium]|nr:hypothetical protein [Clostridiales bacterium]